MLNQYFAELSVEEQEAYAEEAYNAWWGSIVEDEGQYFQDQTIEIQERWIAATDAIFNKLEVKGVL